MNNEERNCGTCKHFRQHYILIGGTGSHYEPIHYGHCVFPRLKKRSAAMQACQRYEEYEE